MTSHWSRDLFERPVERLPVLGVPLSVWRDRAERLAGTEHDMALHIGDNVYADSAFVDELCRRTLDSGVMSGRARVETSALNDVLGSNSLGRIPAQDTIDYDIVARTAAGTPCPPSPVRVPTDDRVTWTPQPGRSSAPLGHASRGRVVWAVNHWTDLLTANLLAVGAAVDLGHADLIAPGASIHPTAVIERSVIGAGATIGAFAVIQNTIVGAGVTIDEHTSVKSSWVGDGTAVQTGALIHRSFVGSNTTISFHTALRGSVVLGSSTISTPVLARTLVGEGVFISRGADVSASNLNDQPVPVHVDGQNRSSGMRLLGCAIGSGARVGSGVRLPAGYEIPAGRFIAERPMHRVDSDAPRRRPLVAVGRRFRPIGFNEGAAR